MSIIFYNNEMEHGVLDSQLTKFSKYLADLIEPDDNITMVYLENLDIEAIDELVRYSEHEVKYHESDIKDIGFVRRITKIAEYFQMYEVLNDISDAFPKFEIYSGYIELRRLAKSMSRKKVCSDHEFEMLLSIVDDNRFSEFYLNIRSPNGMEIVTDPLCSYGYKIFPYGLFNPDSSTNRMVRIVYKNSYDIDLRAIDPEHIDACKFFTDPHGISKRPDLRRCLQTGQGYILPRECNVTHASTFSHGLFPHVLNVRNFAETIINLEIDTRTRKDLMILYDLDIFVSLETLIIEDDIKTVYDKIVVPINLKFIESNAEIDILDISYLPRHEVSSSFLSNDTYYFEPLYSLTPDISYWPKGEYKIKGLIIYKNQIDISVLPEHTIEFTKNGKLHIKFLKAHKINKL